MTDAAPSSLPPVAPPLISVIVVTWNSAGVLDGLLGSLHAGLDGVDWRLTVVDNASEDETVALADSWLRNQASRTAGPDGLNSPIGRVLQTDRNGGYAAAINAALAQDEPSTATLVLNPGIRLEPGCVRRMLDVLDAPVQPPPGIVVPRIRDAQGNLYRSLRCEPSLPRALGEALLGRHAGRIRWLGETVSGDPAAAPSPPCSASVP